MSQSFVLLFFFFYFGMLLEAFGALTFGEILFAFTDRVLNKIPRQFEEREREKRSVQTETAKEKR